MILKQEFWTPEHAFDALEAEHPPAAGVVHAGEIEAAECTLVEGVELVETEVRLLTDCCLAGGIELLDDTGLGRQM